MKMKNILLSAVAASTLFVFGSQTNNASANSKIIPKAYRGNWYRYGSPTYMGRFLVTKDKVYSGMVKNKNKTYKEWAFKPSVLTVGKNDGKKSNYYSFAPNDSSDYYKKGLEIWTKKMTVDGKNQTVLVLDQNYGYYAIATKKPINNINISFGSWKKIKPGE